MFAYWNDIQRLAGRVTRGDETSNVQQKRKICPLFLKKSEVPKAKKAKREEKANSNAKSAVGVSIG